MLPERSRNYTRTQITQGNINSNQRKGTRVHSFHLFRQFSSKAWKEFLEPCSSRNCDLFAFQTLHLLIKYEQATWQEEKETGLVVCQSAHLLEKAASQCVHLYFLSPVCSLIWRSRLLLCLKRRLQNSHRNGIWSLCVCNKEQVHWKQYAKHRGGNHVLWYSWQSAHRQLGEGRWGRYFQKETIGRYMTARLDPSWHWEQLCGVGLS
jgi:hypothetical protein